METVQRDDYEMINMFSCGPSEADGLKYWYGVDESQLRYSGVAFPFTSVLTSANMLITGDLGVHTPYSHALWMD